MSDLGVACSQCLTAYAGCVGQSQTFSAPFVFAGSTFPSAAPAEQLHAYAVAVGKACFQVTLRLIVLLPAL